MQEGISNLRTVRHDVRQNTLLMLYNSFLRSHLLYGILTWGSTNNTVLHPLQVLQNKIVRITSNVKTKERITNNFLYKQLKILKIKDMYELEVSKFIVNFLVDFVRSQLLSLI